MRYVVDMDALPPRPNMPEDQRDFLDEDERRSVATEAFMDVVGVRVVMEVLRRRGYAVEDWRLEDRDH